MAQSFQDKLTRNQKFFEERQDQLAERNLRLARAAAFTVVAIYLTFQPISKVLYGRFDLRLRYLAPSLIMIGMCLLAEYIYRRFGNSKFLSRDYPILIQSYVMAFAVWIDFIAGPEDFQIYTPLALVIGPILFFLPLRTELLISTVTYAVFLAVILQAKIPDAAAHAFYQTTVGYVLSIFSILFMLDIRSQEAETYAKLVQEQRFREEIESGRARTEELLHELQVSHSVVQAVTDIYYVLYECDLIHNTFSCIQANAYVREFTSRFTNAHECLQALTIAAVYPEDQEKVSRFYDTNRWPEMLQDRDNLSIEFRSAETGWSRGTLIAAERDAAGHATRVLSAIQDIHETKLRSIAARKALQDALEQAQQANRAKTEFLNSMSHDIRTPMNAIIGFSTLAQDHLTEPETMQDYLTKIKTAGSHLLSLINDVLDMSRIESGHVQIHEEAGSLKCLMTELGSILQSDIRAKGLDYRLEIGELSDDSVYFDKLRLNQILINIISNSIKYTNPGGTITVSLEQRGPAEQETASYLFTVKDNGIGMKKEFLEHIFEAFTREKTSTVSGIQGTGLGLAITKKLVDLMGGQIRVSSTENVGTETELELTLRIAGGAEETKETAQEIEAVRFDGRRVLLVEDNELNREIAVELLKETGVEIDTAENGKLGAERFARSAAGYYGLILMDIQMPVMDGYEATKTIRAMDRHDAGTIPIIALTANAFTEDSRYAGEIGMNEYLTKPFNPTDLNRMLVKYLR